MFRVVVAARPTDARAAYFLGRVLALTGHSEEAMDHLERAINLDSGQFRPMAREDEGLASLREDPRFWELVGEA